MSLNERPLSCTELPTFIIIGPGRSGTSWMYEMLRAHPDVCMAKNTKETLFFDREWNRGEGWYKAFFRHCGTALARGEICNTYLYHSKAALRIKSLIPSVTLIACLRNPYERLCSAYRYRLRSGEAQGSFEAVIRAQPELVRQGRYAQQLREYFRCFPASQIKLLMYDDLKANPLMFLRDLYSTIGVDATFLPDQATKLVNPTSAPRFASTAKLLGGSARLLRKIGGHNLLDRLKRSDWIRNFVLVPVANPDLLVGEALRSELRSIYTGEIEQIEEWTGRDLQSWKNF